MFCGVGGAKGRSQGEVVGPKHVPHTGAGKCVPGGPAATSGCGGLFDLRQEPDAVTCPSGSVWEAPGNRGPYRDERLSARQRATVPLIDMDAAAARMTQKKVGSACHKYACDVTDRAAVQRTFAAAVAKVHGSIDIWVNSAGIVHTGTAEPTIEAGFERVLEVNVKGVSFP